MQPESPIADLKVSFALAWGGRGTGRVIFTEVIGLETVYNIRIDRTGHVVKLLASDVRIETPVKKTVRSIGRKLGDLAEAAQNDELYARRFDRLEPQIKALAAEVIATRYSVSVQEVFASPRAEELLASALVQDWDRVQELIGHAKANSTLPDPAAEVATPPARLPGLDPAFGMRTPDIRLEPRDPKSPFNFPCCGGLRPAHTSHCREA